MKRLLLPLCFAASATAQPMAEPIMVMDQVVPQIDCVPHVRAQAALESMTRAEMRSALLQCRNQNLEALIDAERTAIERLEAELGDFDIYLSDSEWLIGLPEDPDARIEFLQGQMVLIRLKNEEINAERRQVLDEVDAILAGWVHGN